MRWRVRARILEIRALKTIDRNDATDLPPLHSIGLRIWPSFFFFLFLVLVLALVLIIRYRYFFVLTHGTQVERIRRSRSPFYDFLLAAAHQRFAFEAQTNGE